MKTFVARMILVLGFACTSFGVQAQVAAEDQIQSVIQGQIDAFEIDDFDTAFTFASPSIQQLFGSVDRFGAMVRNGYPMVWRPKSLSFAELREIEGALWQKLIVQDMNGTLHALDYRMVEIDGKWRISGVQLLPAPDLAV